MGQEITDKPREFGDSQLDFFSPVGEEEFYPEDFYNSTKEERYGLQKMPDFIIIRSLLKERKEWERREQIYRSKIEEQHRQIFTLKQRLKKAMKKIQ